METEEIRLLEVTKKNGKTAVTMTPDTDKYQILGILTTYTRALKEELTNEWRPEDEEEE